MSVSGRFNVTPYIRSKGLANRPRAARRAPTLEIIIIMTGLILKGGRYMVTVAFTRS